VNAAAALHCCFLMFLFFDQGRRQVKKCGVDTLGECAERESPWSRVKGQGPLKLKTF